MMRTRAPGPGSVVTLLNHDIKRLRTTALDDDHPEFPGLPQYAYFVYEPGNSFRIDLQTARATILGVICGRVEGRHDDSVKTTYLSPRTAYPTNPPFPQPTK